MTSFGIRVEYLSTPELADPSAPEYAEWPPAPDRIYQAMIAAAAATGQDMSPLRHLESAPAIEASDAKVSSTMRYVPENFRRASGYHTGAARYFPMAHPTSPVVGYAWDNVPGDALDALERIASEVTCLGRASSRVIVTTGEVKPDWIPAEDGGVLYRVPYSGRLGDLRNAYADGRRAITAPMVAYRSTGRIYPSAGLGDMLMLSPDQYVSMTKCALLADQLRKAVISVVPDPVPGLIHGHDTHRHAAWISLPDVGHRYARGHLLGIGVCLPTGASAAERGQVGPYLMRVNGLGGIGLSLPSREIKGLQRHTWARPANVWATATPIVLDRQARRSYTAEQSISDSLVKLGLPAPASVETSRMSMVRGAPASNRFRLRKSGRQYTHAVIAWSEPIAGPLLVGAERYFGLGLCRPMH